MLSPETEAKLAKFIAQFYDDPYGFVMAVFPWGKPLLPDGSPNPLAHETGPDEWQKEMLLAMGEHIKENRELRGMGLDMHVWRSAIGSGHGAGKSAFVAWVIYFFMSTRRDTRGVVTASTQFQLEDKTWPELAKWHSLAINRHWFDWSATAFTFAPYPEDRRKNYRVTAATVSEEKTEAFAGLHNASNTVIVIFDEASGVASKVWEVAEGALTDGEAFFFAFGNMTRPEGEFVDCFYKHSHLYYTRNIDTRTCKNTNKNALADTIAKYGIDSDEVRVRILGLPPRSAISAFMDADLVREAMVREGTPDRGAGLIMAVDVSGEGDDEMVIAWRQGRDARSRPMRIIKGALKTPQVLQIIKDEIDRSRPDAVVVEMVGTGVAIVDMLRHDGYRVHGVYPGTPPDDKQEALVYYNKRIYWWKLAQDAMYDGLCIPDDPELFQQFISVQRIYDNKEQKMLLEPKKKLKDRGLPSPDRADTIALTYAVQVPRRDLYGVNRQRYTSPAVVDYDPLTYGMT